MKLRGTEFGPVIDLPARENRHSKRIVKFGAGVMLEERRSSGLAIGTQFSKPFFVSLRLAADHAAGRRQELDEALIELLAAKKEFQASFALVLSIPEATKEEFQALLKQASVLGAPLVPEVSLLVAPETAADILRDPYADALYISDTVLWSDLPARAQKVFFRMNASPFKTAGGGFVSGKYLLPLAVEWVGQLKRQFIQKPIITGAGVLRPRDASALFEAGASAITLGTARALRPWNVFRIIRRCHSLRPHLKK